MKNASLLRTLGGSVLIFFGVLFLLSNFLPDFHINWGLLWPLFLLIPGAFFCGMYLLSQEKERDWGLLIPGSILLFLGLTFFVNMFASSVLGFRQIWVLTSFMYPGSVAISFWISWWVSGKEPGMLIPAGILTAVSFVIFVPSFAGVLLAERLSFGFWDILWPSAIILLGLWVIVGPVFKRLLFPDGRYFGKNEGEWEEWGKNFGTKMEKMGEKIERSVQRAVGEDDEEG